MEKKFFEPHAEIVWEEDVKAVRVVWKKLFMTLTRFQEICQTAFEILQSEKGAIWIADQYRSEGVFNKEIQDFMMNDLAVIAHQNGLRMVLTILPMKSALSAMSVKRWSAGLKEKREFMNEQFSSLEDCKEWVLHVNAYHE